MVPPGRFKATCVSGAPTGPDRALQGQQIKLKKRVPTGPWPTPAQWHWKQTTCLYIMYYYTPLPLNLANKQQASNKRATSKQQALLLSVLAIARSHRSGLYCTLAIPEPRWWPCQIQVLSQKLTGGAPGRGRQVGRCPPKTAQFWAPKQPFSAQNGPETRSKRANDGKRFLHSTCASIAP